MKRKINQYLLCIAGMTILITLLSLIAVFYGIFQRQVMGDLRTFCYLLKASVQREGEIPQGDSNLEEIRITWMDADGTVLADSNADVDEMDNHLDRTEIAQAIREGEGTAIRRSDTMSRDTFYYAILMEDGSVLRAARETDSIWSIFQTAFPAIFLVVAGMAAVSVFVSHAVTRHLVKPIEEMAKHLGSNTVEPVYKELAPFVNTIRQQHEDILRSAHIRQEFTANVSHELKTPLTVISGYSELIQSGIASGEDAVRFAGEIHKNASRLLTLINDIIRLSQLDSDDREMAKEAVDLYQTARGIVDLLKVNAEKQEIAMTLGGSPQTVAGDRRMLEELIYNLCDNAIRYNKRGGTVAVTVGHTAEGPFLSIKDTGIGIPPEHQQRVFERFYRVDKGRSKSTGGTGLGLAIVKHIVTWHGAELKLESEEGKGTEIVIRFPG